MIPSHLSPLRISYLRAMLGMGLRHPLHRTLAVDPLVVTVYLGGEGARLGACRCMCGLINIPMPADATYCLTRAVKQQAKKAVKFEQHDASCLTFLHCCQSFPVQGRTVPLLSKRCGESVRWPVATMPEQVLHVGVYDSCACIPVLFPQLTLLQFLLGHALLHHTLKHIVYCHRPYWGAVAAALHLGHVGFFCNHSLKHSPQNM